MKSEAGNDGSTERTIGNLLRAGVLASAALVLLGGAIYLSRHGHEIADYRVFRGSPSELRTLAGMLRAAASARGRGLIQLGLVVLIATPVARVGLAAYLFLRRRDWLYVVVSLIVLAVLLFSLAGGSVHGGPSVLSHAVAL